MVINSIIEREWDGEPFRVSWASVLMDKHPVPSRRRPRPVWGVIDGLFHREAILDGISAMLSGAEHVKCLFLDTDSVNGDFHTATRWLLAPMDAPHRLYAALEALLRLPPISHAPEVACTFRGHAAKRFLQNVCKDSPKFTNDDGHEAMRSSQSVAQTSDLTPTEAMLRRHSIQIALMPERYGSESRVSGVFDLLLRIHVEVRAAARRMRSEPDRTGHTWGERGVFQ